jgi:hypothetical protein
LHFSSQISSNDYYIIFLILLFYFNISILHPLHYLYSSLDHHLSIDSSSYIIHKPILLHHYMS